MTDLAAGAPILDLDQLVRQTFGDEALAREVLALFEKQCERLLPILARPGAAQERADAAHTLKGAARAIGAGRIAALADAFERTLAEEGASGRLVPQLQQAVAEVHRAIAERRTAEG